MRRNRKHRTPRVKLAEISANGRDTHGTDVNSRGLLRRQLARFLVIGSTSVAIDCAMYALLSDTFSIPRDAAKGMSYLAGVAFGYCGNKWWTFESHRCGAAEPISYLALYSITLLVNVACNRAVLYALGGDQTQLAFLFATGVSTVLNFAGMKWFTFRQAEGETIAADETRRAA